MPHCLPGILGQQKTRHHSLFTRITCGNVQITFLKQVGLGKGCNEKEFPTEELNAIFYNSVYIVKRTALVQTGIKGRVGMI